MSDNTSPAAKRGIEAKWLILAAVMLGAFMGPVDASIVNTVLPNITSYFKTDISIAQWVPTVYLVTISCLILLYGRLGDMVGYKRIFLTGLAAFVVASILCGSSQSIWMLIVFRGLQGLAAGLLMAVGYAIIVAAFPPFERGRAMGIYAVSIAAGLGLGPTFGGLIAQYLSWHYVFFINVPIGIAALIWGSRVIPRSTTKPGQRLDVAGALTALIFLSSLLLYANQGETWGWASPRSLALVGTAVVFGALFVWIERTSAQPMLNLALFKQSPVQIRQHQHASQLRGLIRNCIPDAFLSNICAAFQHTQSGTGIDCFTASYYVRGACERGNVRPLRHKGLRGLRNVYRCRGPLPHERLKCLRQRVGCGMAPGYHWHWVGHVSEPEQQRNHGKRATVAPGNRLGDNSRYAQRGNGSGNSYLRSCAVQFGSYHSLYAPGFLYPPRNTRISTWSALGLHSRGGNSCHCCLDLSSCC